MQKLKSTSEKLLLELNQVVLIWDKELSPEFKVDLASGWIDFEMVDFEPTDIKVWDNEGDGIVCSDIELDKIYEILNKNLELCE